MLCILCCFFICFFFFSPLIYFSLYLKCIWLVNFRNYLFIQTCKAFNYFCAPLLWPRRGVAPFFTPGISFWGSGSTAGLRLSMTSPWRSKGTTIAVEQKEHGGWRRNDFVLLSFWYWWNFISLVNKMYELAELTRTQKKILGVQCYVLHRDMAKP